MQIPDELKQQLDEVAASEGRSVSEIAAAALENYLAQHQENVASIRRGIDDLEAGRTIDGDLVDRWLASWGTDHELPRPK